MFSPRRKIVPLTSLALGTPATVVRLKLEAAEVQRLQNLGMRMGAAVRVLEAAKGAPLLVAVGDARIAVNYDVGEKIFVFG